MLPRRLRVAVANKVAPEHRQQIDSAVVRGIKKALIGTLNEKEIELPKSDRARIDNCFDLEEICRWYVRAVSMDPYDDLFPA